MPMKHKLLPLLIALTLFFSGCLGLFEDDPEPGNDDDQNGDDGNGNGDDGNGGGEGGGNGGDGNGNNETLDPPEASLSANVTTGDAPLAVAFTLDAEHEDKEGLTWSLDLDDGSSAQNGEGLPADVEHTFSNAGNFTVVLTVTYGDDSDEAEVEITVTEAASGPNALQEGVSGLCLDYFALYLVAGVEEPGAPTVDVDAGTGYELSSESGTVYIDFLDADGESVGYNENAATEGTVPANAAYGIMCVMTEGVPMPGIGDWTYQDGF